MITGVSEGRAARMPGGPLPLFMGPSDVSEALAPPPRAASTGQPECPTCDGRPPLATFRRYEAVTYEPLRFCERCHGFWARGDSLSRGVADPYADHPALRQVPVEPRCKPCFGRLDETLHCRKCKQPLTEIPCPACNVTMSRVRQDGVLLDICSPCEGVWFETGELPRLYGLTGMPPTLLERMGPPPSAEPEMEPGGWGIVIPELIALALRFLPLR
jgi:Zn-finger nucleic acid-binding protein